MQPQLVWQAGEREHLLRNAPETSRCHVRRWNGQRRKFGSHSPPSAYTRLRGSHPQRKQAQCLPLKSTLEAWEKRWLAETCDLCLYVRLPDYQEESGRGRFRDEVNHVMTAALGQRDAAAHAHTAKQLSLEVVSNCRPASKCRKLISKLKVNGRPLRLPSLERDAPAAATVGQ